jgi:hypothetical protein
VSRKVEIANAQMCTNGAACLQTELQWTKTLPQAATQLVNSRIVGYTEVGLAHGDSTLMG